MATETVWRLRGDVMETCSCATTCPCNFGSDPIPLPCEVVLGWRIADGQYGNTRLGGLNVVLYGRIPGYAFQGNWTVGVYLDQNADQQQAQALGNILSGQAGGWLRPPPGGPTAWEGNTPAGGPFGKSRLVAASRWPAERRQSASGATTVDLRRSRPQREHPGVCPGVGTRAGAGTASRAPPRRGGYLMTDCW